MSDQDIARPEHGEHSVETSRHGGFFMDPLAVAWYVDGDRVVPEILEFRDRPAPTPGAVESTVNQDEAHYRTPFESQVSPCPPSLAGSAPSIILHEHGTTSSLLVTQDVERANGEAMVSQTRTWTGRV